MEKFSKLIAKIGTHFVAIFGGLARFLEMDEQLVFTTNKTACVTSLNSQEQSNLKQCVVGTKNSACIVNDRYLFVAQERKALINVYNLSGSHKRESVEQRIPIPEAANCLEVVPGDYATGNKDSYLLLASTESGKIYIWELESGLLLNVKAMAHYQQITKMKSILQGKYIITSGRDSRVIIWQTLDLISLKEPKPISVIHDHTLAVTDFAVSTMETSNLFQSSVKLYTVSEDCTLRCYEFNMNGSNNKKLINSTPNLIATFTFIEPIQSLILDPAERTVFLGTTEGCYQLSTYYKLTSNKILNLLQINNSENQGKIYSLVKNDFVETERTVQDRLKMFQMGQISIGNVFEGKSIEKLEISMDGTNLIVGDKLGSINIIEIFSKQVIRTIQPISVQETVFGSVTNIILKTTYESNEDNNIMLQNQIHHNKKRNENFSKFPILQRSIYNKNDNKQGQHEIWFQNQTNLQDINVIDIDKYMANIASEETKFLNSQ